MERDFMEQLHDPSLVNPPVAPRDLPAALARLRQVVTSRLAELEEHELQADRVDQDVAALSPSPAMQGAARERMVRREARLARLHFETDAFLVRLTGVEAVEALKASQRQEDELQRAYAMSAAIVAGRDRKAAQRASLPVDRITPLTTAPWRKG